MMVLRLLWRWQWYLEETTHTHIVLGGLLSDGGLGSGGGSGGSGGGSSGGGALAGLDVVLELLAVELLEGVLGLEGQGQEVLEGIDDQVGEAGGGGDAGTQGEGGDVVDSLQEALLEGLVGDGEVLGGEDDTAVPD
eukprot:249834_1